MIANVIRRAQGRVRTTTTDRNLLAAHIASQAERFGPRCPATQKKLRVNTSVLIKLNDPQNTWCVVDGYAYDCALQDHTIAKLERETVYKMTVLDGRTL